MPRQWSAGILPRFPRRTSGNPDSRHGRMSPAPGPMTADSQIKSSSSSAGAQPSAAASSRQE
eukprot:15443012-Alexandrium_andersonii.AAC.1